MNKISNKIILFSKICPIDELKSLICTISIYDKDKKSCSQFHQRILKCRMIIFTIPQILAAPDPVHKLQIIVLFNDNITDELRLREELTKIKLNVLRKAYVNPSMLEMCFKYTLEAKISPLWNMVDRVYVKGRDFLLENAPLDAAAVNIYITDNILRLEINCYKIILKQFDIKDLEVSGQVLDYFFNVFDAKLSENSICEQWVHVLPRLTKARIISVNKQMPKSQQFNSYKELRRHWKNIYGYRLPDKENNLLFYEIHFRPFGSELYTYPSICLRSNLPLLNLASPLHSSDIIQGFLKDLKQQFPGVFGIPIDLDYIDPLTSTIPYSNINGIPNPPTKTIPETIPIKIEPVKKIELLTQNISPCTPKTQILSNCSQTNNITKYYPLFLPKNIKKPNREKPKLPSPEKLTNIIENNKEKSMINKISIIQTESISSQPTFVPKFTAKKQVYPKTSNGLEIRSIKNIFNNNNRMDVMKKDTESQPITSKNIVKSTERPKPYNQFLSQPIYQDNNIESINTNRLSLSQEKTKIFNHFNSIKSVEHKINNSTPKKPTLIISNSQQNNENASQESSSSTRKRKRAEVDLSMVNDVPILARNDPEKLKKVNRDTIAAWLKTQQINVTTRMTKPQLMEKLFEKINNK